MRACLNRWDPELFRSCYPMQTVNPKGKVIYDVNASEGASDLAGSSPVHNASFVYFEIDERRLSKAVPRLTRRGPVSAAN